MGDEHLEGLNSAERQLPAAQIAPATKVPAQPGAEKVILYLGMGCFVFFVFMSIFIGTGAYFVYSIARNHPFADDDAVEAPPEPEKLPEYGQLPGETFDPDEMPEPPLALQAPEAPSSRLGEVDLTSIEPRGLFNVAFQYYEHQNYEAAIRCQHQAVIKSHTGQYNLACFYARAGDIPAALYWLQVGAREEESNADWAAQDSDLVAVRKDRRWPQLLVYLRAYQKYWETAGSSETSLVVPHAMTAGQPLPIFIGLHGLGDSASHFIDRETYQPLADEMGVAFLGVSGTISRGKHSFVWSEDSARDLARIDTALSEVADRVTPAGGKTVLFGFSQGAAVSAELAARHPDRFAGAIVVSPGSAAPLPGIPVNEQSHNQRQGVVVVAGAREHPKTLERTNYYAGAFRRLGARVYLRLDARVARHNLPADFFQKLPAWGKFILNPDAPLPAP